MSQRTQVYNIAFIIACAHAAAAAGQAPRSELTTRCAALADLSSDQLVIDAATNQPAGEPVTGALSVGLDGDPLKARQVAGLPAFCRVQGSIRPEPGSDIRFEVWLPSEHWDGRFNGGFNGGFAGSITYSDLAQAVLAGQVGASTDTGHVGSTPFDSAWAIGHPERVRDFGWRAIHLTTVVAKQLIAQHYGRGPDHSYFLGCSNGGRQGLMEAARFPEDYDGIVAGAPAARLVELVMSFASTVQAQLAFDSELRPEQMPRLQAEVIRQCDALDDSVDGLVSAPWNCQFDSSKLACTAANIQDCFSPAQISALEQIFAGRPAEDGKTRAAGYPASGAEVGAPIAILGWETWITRGQWMPTVHAMFASSLLQDFVSTPIAMPETFDFDRDPARLRRALAADLDVEPNLQKFFARGGKLILWHGWADAAVPTQLTLDFYAALRRNSPEASDSAARLFMVPGVQHCASGPGPDRLGQFSAPSPSDTAERSMGAAVQAWVETGRAPDQLIAGFGLAASNMDPMTPVPARERLLCAYPKHAVLHSGEDPDKSGSYECRE